MNYEDLSDISSKQIRDFKSQLGYLDSTSNDYLDQNETIYQENDNNTVGDQTFGDRLATVTVRNNGSLLDAEIERISLLANGTELVNTTSATNGTWVLQPNPADAFFGPAGNGTEFTLETTLAENATAGETVALWVPPANDSGTKGTYDPGDTGVFFEQDSPLGNLGPGTTLTVEEETVSIDGGGTSKSLEPDPVTIDVRLESPNLTTAAGAIPVTIETNTSNRTLQVRLRDRSNNSTIATRNATTAATGLATVSFDTRPGRFRVVVTDPDTGMSASTEAFTIEAPLEVRFANESYSVPRGEVAGLDVTLRNADLVGISIDGPTGRLLYVACITNASDVPRDRLRLDTTALGQGRAVSGIETASNATSVLSLNESTAGRDVTRAVSRSTVRDGRVPAVSNASPAVIPQKVGRPLGAGLYNISLYYTGNVTDTATIRVTAEWSGSVQTLVAPAGARLDSAEQIRKLTTPRSEIAAGDRLVLAVNTSGLAGYGLRPRKWNTTPTRADSGPKESTGQASPGTGSDAHQVANGSESVAGPVGNDTSINRSITATMEGSDTAEGAAVAGNESTATSVEDPVAGPPSPTRLAATGAPGAFASVGPTGPDSGPRRGLPTVAFRRIPDPDSGTVYLLAVPRANLSESLHPGRRYGAQFVLNESSPFVPGLSTSEAVERESIGRNFTAVAPVATFSSVSDDGSLDLEPATGVPVNGTTTVSPGTVLTIRFNASDPDGGFILEEETTVEEDGTYETTLDLVEYDSSTNYTVSVSANGERISPLRTGQLTETGTEGAASASGFGGGESGSPGGHQGTDDSEAAGTVTSAGSSADSTPNGAVTDDRRSWDIRDIDSLPGGSLSELPPPLRLGAESLVTVFLGLLALLAVGIGVRRLL